MAYVKIKTDSGVTFNAPLKSRADYQRAMKFLEQELSTLETSAAVVTTSKRVKREPAGTAEFLAGTR